MPRDHRLDRDDYGQADYSRDYAYDPRSRAGYRIDDAMSARRDEGRDYDREAWLARREEVRVFEDAPRYRGEPPRYADDTRRRRRDGPSDRVLWAVIMERLEDDRRLDLREVQVDVYDGEVTLDGHVRRKADKRRIEDIADIDGVRHVQNNLRVRERSGWTFL